jgi:hypothetical protein
MATQAHTHATSPTTAGAELPPVPVRVAELAMYDAQLDALRREVDQLVDGLTDPQVNWSPAPGRWSIAQNLRHIVLVTDGFLEKQHHAVERARMRHELSDGPYVHGWIGRQLLGIMEPPVRRKVSTAKTLVPPDYVALEAVLKDLHLRHHRMHDAVRRATGLDLGRVKVGVPGIPLVQTSLGQSIALMFAHERRHLWHARQVREHQNFPNEVS